jgi:hypothetical protein
VGDTLKPFGNGCCSRTARERLEGAGAIESGNIAPLTPLLAALQILGDIVWAQLQWTGRHRDLTRASPGLHPEMTRAPPEYSPGDLRVISEWSADEATRPAVTGAERGPDPFRCGFSTKRVRIVSPSKSSKSPHNCEHFVERASPPQWPIDRPSWNCRFPPSLIDFICALAHGGDQDQDSENA